MSKLLRIAQALGLTAALTGPAAAEGFDSKPGELEVKVADPVKLDQPKWDKTLQLRVSYPAEGGPYPLIVYSHGFGCSPESYDIVTEHWVSHGYVVIYPNHIDSPYSKVALDLSERDKLLLSRIDDMSDVLNFLDKIEEQVPDLKGKIDLDKVGVAGHSFGGMTTLIKSGLTMLDPKSGETTQFRDERFKVAVVMSGVGLMDDQMPANAFETVTLPVYASGGTLDLGNTGGPVVFPWEWRMGAYRLTPPGDKYEVVLERGDHYLGGLICRPDRGGPPDAEGAALVAGSSLSFLDAYLKDDRKAKKALDETDLENLTDGRATLSRK